MHDPAALVALDRYPLLDLAAAPMRAVLDWARGQLRARGACEVSDFLSAAGLAAMQADAQALAPTAYRGEAGGNMS
jgi:hypothetical protein